MGLGSYYEDIVEAAVDAQHFRSTSVRGIHLARAKVASKLEALQVAVNESMELLSHPPSSAWEQHLASLTQIHQVLLQCTDVDCSRPAGRRIVQDVHNQLRSLFESTTLYGTLTRTSIDAVRVRTREIREKLSLFRSLASEGQNPSTGDNGYALLAQLEDRLHQHLKLTESIQALWPRFAAAFAETVKHGRLRPTLRGLTPFFLSETQERLVTMDHTTAHRILGASGSGKTAILIHRAVRIARESPTRQVRVFTINRSLAQHIENAVGGLYGELPANVSIASMYDFLKSVLSGFEDGSKYRLVDDRSGERAADSWYDFRTKPTGWFLTNEGRSLVRQLEQRGVDPHEYLLVELQYIQGAFTRAKRRQAYLAASRVGRSIPLLREARISILRLLDEWMEWLQAGDLCDVASATSAACQYFLNPQLRSRLHQALPTDHILVDEFQDFSTLELLMLRHLVRPSQETQTNKWFFVGDVSQKVYAKHIDSTRAGFNFRGKSRILQQNYRNTMEILAAGYCLAQHYPPQADEPFDVITPDYSPHRGEMPLLVQFSDSRHLGAILTMVRFRAHQSLAVVSENPRLLSELRRNLAGEPGFAELFTNDDLDLWDRSVARDPTFGRVSIRATLARLDAIKGYEFDTVIIADVSDRWLPRPGLPAEEHWRDAARLYVAMTRARENLILTYRSTPSSFLHVLTGRVRSAQYDCTDAQLAGFLGKRPMKSRVS